MEILEGQVKKRHRFQDFLYWNLVVAVLVITAIIAIGEMSIAGLVVFLLLLCLMVGLIYRFFCTHCPHYIQSKKGTRCMFFWGMPKFFNERPGPLNTIEKLISFAALFIVIAFPFPWLLNNFGLLLIYFTALSVAGLTMWRYECVRCAFTDCSANRVAKGMQKE